MYWIQGKTRAKLVDCVYDALKEREELETLVLVSHALSFVDSPPNFAQQQKCDLAKKLRLTGKTAKKTEVTGFQVAFDA